MKKVKLGILLILLMFGHNYVLNQTQTMQKPLQQIHHISVTQFNMLYSIPSAVSILFIIPLGFFYEQLSNKLLWTGAIALSVGQLLVTIFGGEDKNFYFQMLMLGRIFQGFGAQILYMLQGNMASSWMGKYAGIVFILPESGQIANVMFTPLTYTHFGVTASFLIGLVACIISSTAAISIYFSFTRHLVKKKQVLPYKDLQASQKLEVNPVPSTSLVPTTLELQKLHNSPSRDGQRPEQPQPEQVHSNSKPKNLLQSGKITWMVLVLCGVNECLYFPFLDNVNQLVTNRFCIPYQDTGLYLSIPFVAAMITSAISSYFIPLVQRHKLILYVSFIPLIGHSLIFFNGNCSGQSTLWGKTMLIFGMSFFGMGIGSYYSVSFPAVGLSVPSNIRGMAYGCMAFFQTISMTLIPIFAGLIIESQTKITTLSQGYKEQSLLFVAMCIVGVLVSISIYCYGKPTSFMYNDQDQLEQSSDQDIIQKLSTKASQSGQSRL